MLSKRYTIAILIITVIATVGMFVDIFYETDGIVSTVFEMAKGYSIGTLFALCIILLTMRRRDEEL